MAAHMAMDPKPLKASPKKSLNHADQTIIDNLSALAEFGNEDERLKKTEQLINALIAKQEIAEAGTLCRDVEYTVGRLVRGLSSSRKLARLGFSVALCQVLRRIPDVSVKHVLDSIDKELFRFGKGQLSKKEKSDVMMGKVVCYLALIQSQRLSSGKKDSLKLVVGDLLKAGKKKTQLTLLCASGIVQIINQVGGKVFKKAVWPEIASEFTKGWGECSPTTLLLLQTASKHHSEVVGDFLQEHWLARQLVSEQNYTYIAGIVKESTSTHPLIHPVHGEIISEVLHRKLDLVKFWKSVVYPLFDGTCTYPRRHQLAAEYFLLLLPHLDVKSQFQDVMSLGLGKLLRDCRQGKNNLIVDKLLEVMAAVIKLVEASKDQAIQLTVLQSLLLGKFDFSFDSQTRTHTVASLMSSLVPEAVDKLCTDLVTVPLKCETFAELKQAQAVIKQVAHMVTQNNVTTEQQLSLLQYLFLHGFFTLKTKEAAQTAILHCDRPGAEGELSDQVQDSARANFLKTIGHIVTCHTQGESRKLQLGSQIDVLIQLTHYIQDLLDSPELATLVSGELSEEALSEWGKMCEVVAAMNKKRVKEEKVREYHAFQILFLHTGLDLFVETDSAIDMLQDLHVCYQKAVQKKKSKSNQEEPAWIEVITELLLSMMSKGSKLSRSLANIVFVALGEHVTPESLSLVTDVLKQGKVAGEGEEEEGPLGLEDDYDEESEDEDEESEDDKEGEEDREDSSEEEEEEEGLANTVNEEFKEEVKAALGPAAAESEDEDDADLSDSEMFKLDEVLAAAFRSMSSCKKKDNRERAKQLVNFKLRVIDMVGNFVKRHINTASVQVLVVPLLGLMEGSRKKKDQKEQQRALQQKATTVFNTMCKARKVPMCSDGERETLLEMMKTLIQFSATVSSDEMVKAVAKATHLVIRLLLNISDGHTGPSPMKTRSRAQGKDDSQKPSEMDQSHYQEEAVKLVETALQDTFHKREGSTSTKFFLALLEKLPLMFWSLSEDLVTMAADETMKVFMRTQAYTILSTLINKKCAEEVGQEGWQAFLESVKKTTSAVLEKMSTDAFKPQYMKALMGVFIKISLVSKTDLEKVLDAGSVSRLEALKSCYDTDLHRLHHRLVPQKHPAGPGKKVKKRKRDKERKKENVHSETEVMNGVPEQETEPSGKKRRREKRKSKKLENNSVSSVTSDNAQVTPDNTPKKKKHKKEKRKSEEEMDTLMAGNESIGGKKKLKKKSVDS